MKYFYRFLPFLAILVFASSCTTINSVVISKRHYRKGLHIDFITSKPVSTLSQQHTRPIHQKADPVINKEQTSPVDAMTGTNPLPGPDPKRTGALHELKKVPYLPAVTPIKLLHKRIVPSAFAYGKYRGDGDSGYWLWTLIAILIILWLISLLTGGWGLGNLIYILLVVALVLLIFRLLGIL